MLKWLVTRGPVSPPSKPRGDTVTDDPLATLNTHSKKTAHEVYAVSRFNPLYEDEDSHTQQTQVPPDPPESPPTDRGSVRSSGYGSKETDSVSDRSEGQDEEDHRGNRVLAGPGGRALATLLSRDPQYVTKIQVGVRRARSLEGLGQCPRRDFSQQSATIPRPVWPRALRLMPRLPPPPPVDLVAQDPRFVTSITLGPSTPEASPPSPMKPSWSVTSEYWKDVGDRETWQGDGREDRGDGDERVGPDWHTTEGESYRERDWQGPDSLVTEETLAMMRRSRHQLLDDESSHYDAAAPTDSQCDGKCNAGDCCSDDCSDASSVTVYETPIPLPPGVETVMPSPQRKEVHRPIVHREPREILAPKEISAPPRTASLASRGTTRPPPRQRRRSFDTGRPGGAVAATALWERSGLKTNGRKLVVSLHHLAGHSSPPPGNHRTLHKTTNVNSKTTNHHTLSKNHHRTLSENITAHQKNPLTSGNTTTTPLLSSLSRHHKTPQNFTTISPQTLSGHDNPAFISDSGSEVSKMAEFERQVNERLGGAPPYRSHWDLNDSYSKGPRRVKFTPDTHSPLSHTPRPPSPPTVNVVGGGEGEGDVGGASHPRGIWTTSLSYHTRHQPGANGVDGSEQELWERYYGAYGSIGDTTIPRHFAPHPNSQAPMCGSSACHDFTVDLRRADKLRRLTESRRRRRRLCCVLLVVVAVAGFGAVVVAVSLYYTQGQRFFGSM